MSVFGDGGPAFPRPSFVPADIHYDDHGNCGDSAQEGMSLRDWLAGKALQGILAGLGVNQPLTEMTLNSAAVIAYFTADAMLLARKGQLKP